MPALGLGTSLQKSGLTGPTVITTGRTLWAPFDYPGQTGTAHTGQALEFDGVADEITTTTKTFDGDFTYSFWYYNASGTPFVSGYNSTNYVRFDSTTNLKLKMENGNYNITIDALSTATWYRIVLTRSGSTISSYINGVASGTVSSSADFIIGSLGVRNNGYYTNSLDGMLSDVQLWNTTWSASDATYDYLNPERLALGNSGTSLTYSDLNRWYPMQDGDRGNQSYLLDSAGTGKNVIGTSDGGTYDTDASSGGNIYPLDSGGSTIAKIVGQAYEYTYTIESSENGGSGSAAWGVRVFPESASYYNTIGTHTFTHVATGTTNLRLYLHDFDGTISNVSVSAVNLKNHGTSYFYGDELITNVNDRDFGTTNDGGTINWTVYDPESTGFTYAEDNSSDDRIEITGTSSTEKEGAELSTSHFTTLVVGRTYRVSASIYCASLAVNSIIVELGGVAKAGYQISTNTVIRTAEFTVTSDAALRIYTTGTETIQWFIDNVSIKEVAFVTGWTDADAQTTIPQLGFQSYNQLAWFDGTADYVTIDDASGLEHTATGFTLSAWCFFPDADIEYPIIFKGTTKNDMEYALFRTTAGIISFRLGDEDSHYIGKQANNEKARTGRWSHIVASWDGTVNDNSSIKIYVNGTLEVNYGNSNNGTHVLSDTSAALLIGKWNDTSADAFMLGSTTEVSIWNTQLSDAQALELYNDGEALDALTHSSVTNLAGYWRNEGFNTWTDLSTNSNNGTPTSITESLILPEGQNDRDTQGFLMNRERVGLNLDGVSASIIASDSPTLNFGTGDFSLSLWIKTETSARNGIIGKYSSTDGWYIDILSNGKIRVAIEDGSSVWRYRDSVATVDSGNWEYIAVVFNGSTDTLSLYINDSESQGDQNNSGDAQNTDSSNTLKFGFGHSAQDHFKGWIDDVAIYSSALSAPQALRNYKAGKGRHRN